MLPLPTTSATKRPVKPVATYPENIPNPERQGGDTIDNAMIIPALPYTDSGTTVGYNNDYDAVCPYTDSTAPDVVYKYVALVSESRAIDLCGSGYDTKLYVMDAAQTVLACNDDFYSGAPCGTYVSLIENFAFVAGNTYYIVVEGYGAASGNYILALIGPLPPCDLVCPAWGVHEGEPNPPVNEYVDNYNGGCNTPPDYPFQVLECCNNTFCGVSGWYTVAGGNSRDTDWFILNGPFIGLCGGICITADAEYETYIFELGPLNCDTVGVIQNVIVGPCAEGDPMIIANDHLSPVWLWVGPTVFVAPAGAPMYYDYTVWVWGWVATEPTSWSTVKALFE